MSILNWVLVFSVLMGAAAFVAGLVIAVRLLRGSLGGGAAAPAGTQLGAVLLCGIGGALVATAMVTAALVTEREVDIWELRSAINALDARVHVYEAGLARMERSLDAAKSKKGGGDQLASEIREQISELRQKRASMR